MNAGTSPLLSREVSTDVRTRAERLSETARRLRRAQAVLGRLMNLLVRASTRTRASHDHADSWQFHQGKDLSIPEEADYDPTNDAFNPAWLVPEQRRLVALVEAVVARVEFLDRSRPGEPRTITLRVHLL